MKKQIKKQLSSAKTIDIAKPLKWAIIGLGIAIVVAWIGWFTCDCLFISKGITVDLLVWDWNRAWYNIINAYSAVVLSMFGAYIVMLLSYMVICGLHIKENMPYYIYQIATTLAAFIGITICIVNAGDMMVQEKYVIDIKLSLPIEFNVYHLDFLKWLSISFGLTIFANVMIFASMQKFDKHTIIRDCNTQAMVLAAASIILFVPFMMSLGWNDKFIGGQSSLSGWVDLIESPITWKHVVCQCVTMPMGVFAGMIMVLQVIRLISVVFVYNQRIGEKKSHLIIFSIITFLVFAAFIVAHVNKLDFEKLINDYKSMKLGCLLLVVAQTLTCVAAGTYCTISHVNYVKRVNK